MAKIISDILHVTVLLQNTAKDALNAFENRYCAGFVKTIVVHEHKSLFSFL